MLVYHLKANGPLFSNKSNIRSELKGALEDVADWSQRRIRKLTPVATGRLRSGWVIAVRSSGVRIDNSVPYSTYVEKRVGMVRETIPAIRDRLKQVVSKSITEILE
jgi:hypothetical protein